MTSKLLKTSFIFQLHQKEWIAFWFSFTLKRIGQEICSFYLLLFYFWVYSCLLLKFLVLSKSLIGSPVLFLFIEMSRNERVSCFEYGRDYTRKNASRHRRTYGVLKCPNCNFHTYSREELSINIKKHSCRETFYMVIEITLGSLPTHSTIK